MNPNYLTGVLEICLDLITSSYLEKPGCILLREDNRTICPDCSQKPVSPGNMNMKYNGLLNLEKIEVSSEAESFLTSR